MIDEILELLEDMSDLDKAKEVKDKDLTLDE